MASSVSFGSGQPVAAEGTDVTTGYPTDGVADVIWAAEHLNYEGPGGLQKAGVQVLRFLLVAVAGVTDDECDTDLGADLDPSGPHLYTSTWPDDEVDALDWVADHYCLTPEQAQLLGGGVLAFLAGLDAAANGTSAQRVDPPPVPGTELTDGPEPPTATEPRVDPEPSRPGTPGGLTVTTGIGQATLDWSPPELQGAGDTTYTIRYRQSFPAPHALAAEPVIKGRILFMSDRDGDSDLYTMNADGTGVRALTDNAVNDWSGNYSPDGSQVAFDGDHDGDVEIFTIAADGTDLRQLTDNNHEDAFPAWSPDGTRIAFQSDRTGSHQVFTMAADGTDLVQVTGLDIGNWVVPSWSPDGTRIAFSGTTDGDAEVYVVDAGGGEPVQLTVNEGFGDRWPKWSPNGTRIAFESDRDGDWEIFTMAADGTDLVQVTANDGLSDTEPAWSPDGARIAFTRGDAGTNEIFLVDPDGDDLLGPVTIGEQAAWEPTPADSVAAGASRRNRQIVTGPPSSRTPLVVGGEAVEITDYPFQLALIHAAQADALTGQYCGATLIDPQWVLTAAHCVENTGDGFVAPSAVSIGAGRTFLSQIGASDRYGVAAIYPHPSYDREMVTDDIALLRLTRPIPGPVATPLPWLEDPLVPLDGTPILKTGWGSTEHVDTGPWPDGLRAVTVNVLGDPGYDFCSTDTEFESSTRICTGSAAHKGACSGDSGGPNVVEVAGFWYLAGVTSYGMTDDINRCGDDVDVVSRVSTYADWIVDYIGFQWTWITGITDPTYELPGLENGWAYTFQVKAENSLGTSPYSLAETITLPTPETATFEAPEQPTEVVSVVGDGQVTFTWAPGHTGAATPVTYTIVHYEKAGEAPSNTTLSRPGPLPPSQSTNRNRAVPTIVGGTPASTLDHPYIVPLLSTDTSDAPEGRFCAGTLVSPRWVITAAHCVDDRTASSIQVAPGIADLRAVTAADRIDIDTVHLHDGYRSDDLTHDIALLRLASDVTAEGARWIPWHTDSRLPLVGTAVTSAGWGASIVDGSNRESVLREAPGVAAGSPGENRCGIWNTFESAQWLCVGGEPDVGPCTGDGGGPVVSQLGMTRLVGVIAYGRGGACADRWLPNVAARVSTYADWIAQRVGEPWQEIAGVTGTQHTITGLENDRPYRFYISAVDTLGRSSAPVVVMATPRA